MGSVIPFSSRQPVNQVSVLLEHHGHTRVLSPAEMLIAAQQLLDQMAMVTSTLESIQKELKQN